MTEELWESHADWGIAGFTDGADPEYVEQIMPLAAAELDGARHVLDIGCGDGQISRLAASQGASVVGIDPTWNCVSVASDRGGGAAYARAGAAALPFADGSFDTAVACLVFEHIDDVDRLCRVLIDIMIANGRSFAIVDQWRFIGDELGAGIERIVEQGRDLVASILESRWRIEFGYEPVLDAAERSTVLRHAQAIHDDGHAVARLARSLPDNLDLDAIAAIFKYRILAGWASFVIDMNRRVGLPFPQIDFDQGIVVD